MTTTPIPAVDHDELLVKVQDMYRAVAQEPHGDFHFETGRDLAERLGYPPSELDELPREAVESFAGVGYFFDLAQLEAGEQVLDLGSGSGKHPIGGASRNEASSRVHWRSPFRSSPSPVTAGWNSSPWA